MNAMTKRFAQIIQSLPILFLLLAAPIAVASAPETGPCNTMATLSRPKLLPTSAVEQEWAGYTYHVEGELVPALTIELKNNQSIYFEHHVLLWKEPSVQMVLQKLKGAFKRAIAGMDVVVTDAKGPGQISFSRDGSGHIFPLHLKAGDEIHVREHQFLAATSNIGYSYERVKGISNMLFGGTGFFIDKFHCNSGEGVLWLHGYGNVFLMDLKPGQQIDVEPGGWLYKDLSVRMETNAQPLTSSLFSSASITTNRFTGPGRVAIQSMYYNLDSGE